MPPARKNMTVREGRGVSTKVFGSRLAVPPEIRPGEDVLEVEHRDEAEERQGERPEADPAEEVDRPLGVALEEADQDQVEHDVERPAQAVLGLAGGAGPVVDDLLGDPRPLPGGEDRDEPVHLAVEPDAFEHPAAIGLQRAAEVVQRDARDPGHQAVGDPRGDLAAEERVVAVLAASPRRRRSPGRASRAAGGCRPGRSGGRRPSAPGSRPAPGRARPKARRSGRSSAGGTRPARARDRAPGSPRAAPPCRRSSRRRRRSARSVSGSGPSTASSSACSGPTLSDLVVDRDQHREIERGGLAGRRRAAGAIRSSRRVDGVSCRSIRDVQVTPDYPLMY